MLIDRSLTFPRDLIMIDGISGSGKTMITALMDAFSNCSIPSFNYNLEYIAILKNQELISDNVAETFSKLIIDQLIYDSSIGREVNLRLRDLSSYLKSSKKWPVLYNMLKEDSNKTINNELNRINFQTVIVHQLHKSSNIFVVKNRNFFRVVCTRHPLYLQSHWESYLALQCKTPRDFTLWKNNNSKPIPWFINRFETLYSDLDEINQAAICISEITLDFFDFLASKPSNTLVFDFEKFTQEPSLYINSLINLVPNLKFNDKRMNRIMRHQKIPRSHISSGPNKKIYQRYGFKRIDSEISMSEDYNRKLNRARYLLRPEVLDIFMHVSNLYEDKFGLWF